MRLAVLNPRGRDPEKSFREGPGRPEDPGHPPVNFHALAACTGGAFHRETSLAGQTGDPVLVLIRRRLRRTLSAVQELRQRGITVIVSWKETGLVQVNSQLPSASAWACFQEILKTSHGALAVTPDLLPIYRAVAPDTPSVFLPIPYPLEFPRWDFSLPLEERSGIFIGTRRFRRPSRCHMLALADAAILSRETGCLVTVVNTEGRGGASRIRSIGIPEERLRIVPPLPYADYLRRMSRHRLVLQRDLSAVPGQVAGDALLCRMPCVGGNGAIERLAFPDWSDGSPGEEGLLDVARALLTDDDFWQGQQEAVWSRAVASLSYREISERLAAWLSTLPGPDGTQPDRSEPRSMP